MECAKTKITESATAAQNELGASRSHNEYANEFAKQLREKDVTFERGTAVQLQNGETGYPDFTVTHDGTSVCHIEVKAKNHISSADVDQAKAYKEASSHDFVALVNFGKHDGPIVRFE